MSGCGDRCVAHFELEDGAACRHVARDLDRATKLERGGGHDHKGVLKAFVSSLVALFWECTFNSAHMLAAGPARCGFLVFLCAVYGYAVIALDIGLENREANRSEQSSCMDSCLREGGTWDEMCDDIRDRILTMPDHESEVGKNALRHCEQGRRHHNKDCEFKCWHQASSEF